MKILLFLLASALTFGCGCTMEKAEDMVGACEKQKEIVEGPPRTIYVQMPAISVPHQVVLECESWTEEMVRSDPVGYEEVLINDILMLVGLNVDMADYLGRLERARKKLELAANNPEDPPE